MMKRQVKNQKNWFKIIKSIWLYILDEKPILKKARIDDIKTENNKNIEVYTDGACRNNGKKSASATIGVYWGPKNPL